MLFWIFYYLPYIKGMLSAFPDFAPLVLDHKEDYERLVQEYPPFSDISFATLHIWWNLEGKLQLSILNGNVIINYHLPFDSENSGLSIVGKHSLEATFLVLFEYLRKKGKPVKLVHVPEFVIKQLRHLDWLQLEEEIDYNEYILDSKGLANLEGASYGRVRRKVNRFLREVEDREVEIRELDLLSPDTRDELFRAITEWEKDQPSKNDRQHIEHQAIKQTLDHAEHFGIRHMGLYIDNKLHAIVLYHQAHDNNHFILHHLKVDYSIPYIFDYVTHRIADKAAQEGINFLNMEMDLGIDNLRQHKMGLRPVEFFRKYTVRPAKDL